MTKKDKARELATQRRTKLSELSKTIQPLVKEGVFSSVNEGLKEMYFGDNAPELNTFLGWKDNGFSVKKGEHAFLFWGYPLSIPDEQDTEHANDDPDKKMLEFFPVCHLFATNQVHPL